MGQTKQNKTKKAIKQSQKERAGCKEEKKKPINNLPPKKKRGRRKNEAENRGKSCTMSEGKMVFYYFPLVNITMLRYREVSTVYFMK